MSEKSTRPPSLFGATLTCGRYVAYADVDDSVDHSDDLDDPKRRRK
jgi:hypothetical protein